MVTKSGHIPGEAWNQVDLRRVDLQIDQQLAALRWAKACEIPEPLVCPVRSAHDTVHVVPESE
jgi:hypothetical protein